MTLEDLVRKQTEWLDKLAATMSGRAAVVPADELTAQLAASRERLDAVRRGREAMVRRVDLAIEREEAEQRRLELALRDARAPDPRGGDEGGGKP